MITSEDTKSTWVKYLESNIRVFIRTSIIIFILFAVLLIIFGAAYANASLTAYNAILVSFIVVIGICILMFMLMSAAIIYTYINKKSAGVFLYFTKMGLKILLPLALMLTNLNNQLKKSIRCFYIELNNIVVESSNKKYLPGEVMLLLPHCLQNSECGLKVTSNPGLCRKCHQCKIGRLLEYCEQKNIAMFIATGGTVARNIIKQNKPKLIISVACERDLLSGISDVKEIPVVGIMNRQPHGPCFNTDVDLEAIKRKIEEMTY